VLFIDYKLILNYNRQVTDNQRLTIEKRADLFNETLINNDINAIRMSLEAKEELNVVHYRLQQKT
jgi:hypothetical protein